ncbi:MAG: potassium channel family protein [Candidatus Hodarchaeales archaeon]
MFRGYMSFLIVLSKLKFAIILLFAVIITGTSAFFFLYSNEYDSSFKDHDIADSLAVTVGLLVGLDIFQYPKDGNLIMRIVYLSLPVAGLIFLGAWLIELGLTMFTKQNRTILWNEWMAGRMKSHTILCGCGNVGKRILEELISLDMDVTAITIEDEKVDILIKTINRESSVALLFGDASDPEMLVKANIREADAILVATNNDLLNLKIASLAKEMNPNIRTVVRCFDVDFAKKINELLDIDAAFSTSAIAAPAFVAASIEDGIVQTLYKKEKNKRYHMIEIIFSRAEGSFTVRELEDSFEINIIALNNEVHPEYDEVVNKGDKVLLLAELDVIKEIKKRYC